MALKCLKAIIKDKYISIDEAIDGISNILNKCRELKPQHEYIAQVVNPYENSDFFILDDTLKNQLNLESNYIQTKVNITAIEAIIQELKTKLQELDLKLDGEIVTLNDEILKKASIENLNSIQDSLNNYALKSEIGSNVGGATQDLSNLATKDELNTKADISTLESYTTKEQFTAMVTEIQGLFDQLVGEMNNSFKQYAGVLNGLNRQVRTIGEALNAIQDSLDTYALKSDLNALATKDELSLYALKSEISTSGGIDENALNEAINKNSNIQELGAKVNHLATNLQGASYAQLVATFKYLGYNLPTELKAFRDYNLYADERLSGDLTISFKPIEYGGSYGQSWENVAIYNDLGEKLTAKLATISGDGLRIDAIFAKDEAQPKGDSWEAVPSDYALLDGEVRVSITLGAVNYYGANYGLRMLNNNPSSYSESFLAANHSYDEWVFTFHNYKPTKFSITNGTHTYGGYGYLTKYELKLSIANWSKTLTYENSNYPYDIEIDFTNLNFGSDTKTIELAKAWNIPVTEYDITQDFIKE